jgi:hypothetical protein
MYQYITYFEIAAFITSLLAWKVIKTSTYLRLFPLLLLIIVSVEGYETFLVLPDNVNNAWIYNIAVPVQYLIYLAILHYSINNYFWRKIILVFGLMLIVIAIITEMYFTRNGTFNAWSYSLGSAFAIIIILVKFYDILKNPTEFNFIYNPFFYMLFAFLLFNVGTLPYFVMAKWLTFQKHDVDSVKILSDVMSILNYILYSVYTIAFAWMRMKGSFS